MRGPRASTSDLRPWHARIEHYTPDGPLGRFLLATVAGSVGTTGLLFAITTVVEAFAFWPILALLSLSVGLAGVGLALVVLWPVYLSLIGNVESASEYPEGGVVRPPARTLDADDAVSVLKRRYAAGEVSESEFERRLDDILGVEAALDSHRESSARERGDIRLSERN
ncbi:SHOCT domain-containing protein [Halorussus salilacus]|uniref:SHOCT domain-containing protein n=1 Tax=Halorussus salilacus TaxID=2953750 RepID=UPI0020A1DDAC|nr:SHOCT domain-containing protein [Halorussus salilacus]USZ69455.1 SHOCT domain-containing protein [Halorussus salilacus]